MSEASFHVIEMCCIEKQSPRGENDYLVMPGN